MKRKKLYTPILLSLLSTGLMAEGDDMGTFDFGGWVRADYGMGNRYDDASGEDTLGVSQAAFLVNWKYDNVEAVLLMGGTNLTGDNSDGDIGIKDAFIVWHDFIGEGIDLSVGAQPLLFGLKPNGFPNDRSLQGSIEYGAAGGFAVSQQAGPSIIVSAPMGETFSVRAGLFDTSSSTAEYFENTGLGNIDGSSLGKNYFAQLAMGDRSQDGFYGVLGFEGRYVGDAVDSTETIFDIGVGYKIGGLDLSLEHIQLDKAITNTLGDESYTVFETTYTKNANWYYADYSVGEEVDSETFRVGYGRKINKYFSFRVEYSKDETLGGIHDVESVDFRLEFSM